MDRDSKKFLHKVIIDLICLGAVGFPVLMYYILGNPYERGYFCNDDTIHYPFKESTVSSFFLHLIGLGLPTLTIIFIEFSLRNNEQSRYSFMGTNIPSWLYSAYSHIVWFLFGAACSQLITDIGKYTVGRLRPHFLYICQPDVKCDTSIISYIVDYQCTGPKPEKYKDSRLSFPSGHSSLSFYCMVYLALFLQSRIKTSKYGLAKSLFQFFIIAMAVYCALSRISDYKHHWSDVLAGSILGIIVATLTALFISDLFVAKYKLLRKRNSSTGDIETTNNLQTELK